MNTIIVSAEVRAAIGAANARAIETGQVSVPSAQCWRCGGAVQIEGGGDGSVALSVIDDPKAAITLWSHPECCGSRVVTFAEFDASPAATVPSPVSPIGTTVVVDGHVKRSLKADEDPAYCGHCDHHADRHDYAAALRRPGRYVPCSECPDGRCIRS